MSRVPENVVIAAILICSLLSVISCRETVTDKMTPSPIPTPVATPTPTPAPVIWHPTSVAPIHWQWQIGEAFNTSTDMIPNITVYDIDGFDNDAAVVSYLHNHGCTVIAYLELGDWTPSRPDASQFPDSVKGKDISGWPGEKWLDIRSDAVKQIMSARLDMVKARGFDAVEPDCIDGYENNSGFPLTAQDQLNYNEWIVAQCHARGLSVGLKGDNDQVGALYTYFDWALNEQCNEYNDCFTAPNSYALFVNANKAVFNCEYQAITQCGAMTSGHINSMRRDLGLVSPTTSGYIRTPCIPDTQNTWT